MQKTIDIILKSNKSLKLTSLTKLSIIFKKLMQRNSDFIVVIPARYGSKRLPGKPLIDIKGVPMIVRTFNQCKRAVPASKIVVATDDKRIKKFVQRIELIQ